MTELAIITAARAGCLVPGGSWSASLVGVHDAALSLLHPDGALVSIVGNLAHAEARSFILAGGDFEVLLSWARDATHVNELSRFEEATLRIGYFAIVVSGSPPWDPRPELGIAAETIRDNIKKKPWMVRAALSFMENLVKRRLPTESMFHEVAYRETFISYLNDTSGFPWNLAGFGPGTTPAGDDFISGFLLARRLTEEFSEDTPRIPADCFLRTTAAGRSLLLGSAAGVFPAHLSGLGTALAASCSAEDLTGLNKAVDRMLAHGATSGSDALLGFLVGASRESVERFLMV
jgi:hypothetical protein